jgi:mono/diheme cytochrome c family protein
MKTMFRPTFLLLMLSLTLTACNGAPTPASSPSNTIAPVSDAYIPSLENGQAAWNQAQCVACHGPLALGGIGPQLATTELSYEEFLHAVRTASPPKPAYDVAQLPDQTVYDIYAWVRTQIPQLQLPTPSSVGPATQESPSNQTPSAEDVMGMTIWACRGCDRCHGVFAQGGPEGPTLAELSYPVEEELTRMRSTAETIPEHSVDHITDDVFKKLYKWLEMGCVQDECYQ